MKVGDIVKLKRAITIDNDTGEQVYIDTKERFVVIGEFKHNVTLKYLDHSNHGDELLLGRCFLEVVNDTKETKLKRSLGKTALNEGKGKMPKGTVVKIGVNELADAHEWLRTNGCDIKLNSNEHFTVDIETTKMVFIYSKDKGEVIYLPKRFLEEVTPEQMKLNEQDVLALIDIAIDTGDEEWFNELHSKLSALP